MGSCITKAADDEAEKSNSNGAKVLGLSCTDLWALFWEKESIWELWAGVTQC